MEGVVGVCNSPPMNAHKSDCSFGNSCHFLADPPSKAPVETLQYRSTDSQFKTSKLKGMTDDGLW
jgi:hypothetical protein